MIARNSYLSTSTARDLCRPLFRHKRLMVLVGGGTGLAILLGLVLFPRTYTSEARVFVRLGKESVALDPTATVGPTVNMNESRESEINSELEILRSQALLEDTVDALGAEYVLGGGDESGESGGLLKTALLPVKYVQDLLTSYRGITAEEYAIAKLKKAIVPTVPRKSNVIVVQCRAKRPELAQKILATYVDAFLARHAKANRTSGSYDFFVEQSDLLRTQLQDATDSLRQAKNDAGLITIEGQRDKLQSQNNSIEAEILSTGRSLSAVEAKIASLRSHLDDTPDHTLAEETAGLPNVAADFMRNELYKLQIEEKEVSSRNTEAHPKVKALRRQVKEMQAILSEQEGDRTQTTKKTNPTYQQLHVELLSQQARADSLRAESKSLEQQHAAVMASIHKLNEKEFHVTELVRKTELLDSSYRNYVLNREQARIDQALESNSISNVNVLQPATFTAKPSSPRIGLTLMAGLMLSLLSAVWAAFMAEYFDRSAKTPEQVEDLLGVPVLLSVPRGRQHFFVRN